MTLCVIKMKKTELIQIKGLDLKELKLKAGALRGEIANLTLDKNMKKLKDLKTIYRKKKDLARVLTMIGQKELLMELESISSQSSDVSLPAGKAGRQTEEADEKEKLGKRKEKSLKADS